MMSSGRSRSRALGAPRHAFARGLAALLAAMAMSLQAFVVQPHLHAPSAADLSIETGVSAPSAELSTEHAQLACVVCAVLARTGATPLAHAPQLDAPRHVETADATPAHAAAPRAASHRWRSRAPPTHL